MARVHDDGLQSIRISADDLALLRRAAAAETRTISGEFHVIVTEYATDQLELVVEKDFPKAAAVNA